jgi:hypothetical protein
MKISRTIKISKGEDEKWKDDKKHKWRKENEKRNCVKITSEENEKKRA